ncbi:MAG: hypothetical protein MJK04_28620 [Psychrosphaera sp.]|nr:hypothetical protein [Psychrosphaera sp.]
MSITQDLVAVAQAADNLTQNVSDKITQIDQRVNQFQTDATNIVKAATSQISRAHICHGQQPSTTVSVTAEDDAGLLVKEAFSAGNKHVTVSWSADGQERHWNSIVAMPVGATLHIAGPSSNVNALGGKARTDRACYANGRSGGTSENGSPMIFRNLQPASDQYPFNDHFRVRDEASLISMSGNNTVVWGDGTYLHDQGGMTAYAYGNGLIRMGGYTYGLPCFVLGGGHNCQFYLSGPFVNNLGGTSTCEVRIMQGSFNKVTSDGPVLTADKGFRKLLDKGVTAVTTALLNTQPYEVTTEQAALNDNVHSGYSFAWFSGVRGSGVEADRPRIMGTSTWSHGSGWVLAQFNGGVGELSTYGLVTLESTNIYLGAR